MTARFFKTYPVDIPCVLRKPDVVLGPACGALGAWDKADRKYALYDEKRRYSRYAQMAL